MSLPDFEPVALRAMIERALLTEPTLARAEALWRGVAPEVLSRNHGRAPGVLRASDAGRCSRELWAEIHGKRDLPEDAQGLLKMNLGSCAGAWLACLLGAAAEEQGYVASAEVALGGPPTALVSGHCDLAIYRELNGALDPLLVVEFKFSAWTGAHDGPKPYHLVQACKYARLIGAPYFCVVLYYPSTQARFDKTIGTKVSEPHIEPSQLYDANDPKILSDMNADYERLAKALNDEMPEGDPQEAFRCRSCRFSECERNVNVKNIRHHEPVPSL